jgi:drug/metabolite transporter (DMT)-like permease
VACYAFSIALWLAVLSTTQVTVAYPLLSIGYVIAAVLSFFILGEMIPPVRLAGIALICVGVILISRTA